MPLIPTSARRSRARQNPYSRSQNALSIASSQISEKSGIPARRRDAGPATRKRFRRDAGHDVDDDDNEGRGKGKGRGNGEDIDDGSDSEGNRWKMGEVDSDDDSDLDSDEAMGESDEERFAGYTFGGSSSHKKPKQGTNKAGKGKMDLNEDEQEDSNEEREEVADGEGFINLSDMLDRAETPEDEDEVESIRRASKKRAAPEDSSDEGSDSEDSMSSADDRSSDDSGTDSFTNFSEDEDDTPEDPTKLAALQSLISSLPSSTPSAKRVRLNDPNEGKTPNEYNLSLTSSDKLTLSDLIPTISDPKMKKSLKLLSQKSAKPEKSSIQGKLSAPLPKRQQDRLDRSAAYEKSKETLGRWVDTVKHNREADHIFFPLPNAPNAPIPASKKIIPMTPQDSSKHMTELESKISGILKASNMSTEKEITEFEQLKTKNLSLTDVQARTGELRLARELLYREEIKAKRIKKIKSKSYHRVHKKERLRQETAVEEALALERGGVPDEEEEIERERKRAEERMSLRHKSSKWAKGIKDSGRGAWDDEARDGAIEMARRGEELKRRIEGKRIRGDGGEAPDDYSSESESETDGFDEEGEYARKKLLKELEKVERLGEKENIAGKMGGRLMEMKFMQKADAARRKENEALAESIRKDLEGSQNGSGSEESDSSEDEKSGNRGRMSFKPNKPEAKTVVKKKQERGEFEAPDDSEDGDNDDEGKEAENDDEVHFTNNATSKPPGISKNLFSIPKSSTTGKSKSQNFKKPSSSSASEPSANPWLPQDFQKKISRPKPETILTGKQESKSVKINSKLRKDRKKATILDLDNQEVEISMVPSLKLAPKPASTKKTRGLKSNKNNPTSDNSDSDSDSDSDHSIDSKQINLIPDDPTPLSKKSKKTGAHPEKPAAAAANKKLPQTHQQRELVKRAFAGDDVVREFETEKEKTVAEEGSTFVDERIPGWGSWVGSDVTTTTTKNNRPGGNKFLKKKPGIVDAEKRKDKNLEKVIINEKRIKKNSKYTSPSLPFPFETRAQYERSLRVPIGSEWATQETFRKATMPRVVVRQGVVVEAISRPFK